ncbi:hypothetical protein HN784_01145 [bacterium]|jgi:hypothetical protein|nr:hypothetical protein [bacterium]MBT4251683.1 hypothetical protein [bacterium]MBT4597733.1 hypothetical protein [bacterium]MBT6753745.1 hypothetical protein [bacterium]MBT7037882.1 hypothetical protein [bacterium]
MNLVRRLNGILFGVILLAIISATGIFFFANRDNKKFEKPTIDTHKKSALEYQRSLTRQIKLGSVNGLAITGEDVEGNVASEQITSKEDTNEQSEEENESLLFIGGELERQGEKGEKIKENLLAIAKLKFGAAIFTGNLIEFKEEGREVSKRITGVKELLSSSFKDNFNISFGNGDIFCGERCISGWGEILFGKKIETKELLFAHSFEYGGAKILLLEPGFFDKEESQKMNWLEEKLEKNENKNLIVVSHSSMKGFESDSQDGVCAESCFEDGSNQVDKLFEKYGVDLVIFGDQESFFQQKKLGVTYISSGSFQRAIEKESGGVLFSKIDFEENQLVLSTYNRMLEKIEEFKIK